MKTIYFLRTLLIIFIFSIYSCDSSEDLDESLQLKNNALQKNVSAKNSTICGKIQDGNIVDYRGEVIPLGINDEGYNYQAKTYSGEMFPDDYPGWYLIWKWNDAYLSTKDCNGDQRLDIANLKDSYRGTRAWTTTKWSTTYTDQEGNECEVFQFSKFVAVPIDAYSENGFYYTSDGSEIGRVVPNEPELVDFAEVQSIWNDPCNDRNGVEYKPPGPSGLGIHR